MVMKKGTKIC